ncbi:MAG: deoxyguanosinetriphosphate triphosphohydrolase [Candidatus Omnitrophota bacterium]
MLDIRAFEEQFLASYAMKSHESCGRVYQEKEHPYRSCYQRDRDRIIHSAAFRRLEYKTQVFVNHEGDYYRTRLTHTLEVSQIARTIASALRLNIDLTEAIALAHDLGHTPFGHSGEEALNELMKNHGGFNHNLQSLRVVDLLEEKYPEFLGLNLTWEVREGIAKHTSKFDQAVHIKEFALNKLPSLEAQVVDIADEIAYDNHDLDDGLTSGLIDEKDLENIDLWQKTSKLISKKYPGLDSSIRKYQIIKSLINIQVTDLVEESQKRLAKLNLKSWQDVKNLKEKIISFSPEIKKLRIPLKEFLMKNLYNHYRVIRMSNKSKSFIQELFKVYLAKPEQLPWETQKKLKKEGKKRVICDYIAGMTDRCALDEYEKLFNPYKKV